MCYVSNCICHNRFTHPSDRDLDVLRESLSIGKDSFGQCDVFHKDKQTKENLPLSGHKPSSIRELAHLDI